MAGHPPLHGRRAHHRQPGHRPARPNQGGHSSTRVNRRLTAVSENHASLLLHHLTGRGQLAFLNDVSSVPLQQALRHLQAAFAAFWNKSSGHPKFKAKKRSRASAEYTRSAFRYRDGQLTLGKLDGPLAIVWSRSLPPGAEPSTVTVSRDAGGRWFVSLLVDDAIAPMAPAIHTDTGEVSIVGLDAGLTSLITLSTGEKLSNPRHERRDQQRLAKAQRSLAHKQWGSRNRERARIKVARVHAGLLTVAATICTS
jgi:putative transposase